MASGDRFSGKLAVILHADIAGSTELLRHDEQLAHQRIQDSFRRFGKIITTYHGNVRELRGDALLAQFERASDAVTAALAFQSEQLAYIENLTDDIKPFLRIGIAMGEIVVADNTVSGVGVVLAQRVEQVAAPGGLCITAAIHEALPSRMPYNQTSLGDQRIKGFDEKIRVYRVELKPDEAIPLPARLHKPGPKFTNPIIGFIILAILLLSSAGLYTLVRQPDLPGDVSADAREASLQAEQISIVVLPFTNMSGDPEQEYFVDGMTQDLITDLSKISALTVISSLSSFAYKNQPLDIPSIVEDLSVTHLVEGSVRRSGNQVRISAQLINAFGEHIWADRYDREIMDIFALQDEVRGKIVGALAVKLTPDEMRRLARPLTSSVEAYEIYLRALQQISFFDREAILRSQEMFRRAIELDPGFAAAHSYLAQAYSLAIENHWTEDRESTIELALTNARKGIALDADLPFAHWSLARIYSRTYVHDMQESLAAFEKSIELDPNYADGYVMLGSVQIYLGQAEKALGNIERGMRVNPHFPFWYIHTLGQAQFSLTRYDAAEQSFKKAILRNPAVAWPRMWLIATYGQLGKLEDAEWEISELESLGVPIDLESFVGRTPMESDEYLNRLVEGWRRAGVPGSP